MNWVTAFLFLKPDLYLIVLVVCVLLTSQTEKRKGSELKQTPLSSHWALNQVQNLTLAKQSKDLKIKATRTNYSSQNQLNQVVWLSEMFFNVIIFPYFHVPVHFFIILLCNVSRGKFYFCLFVKWKCSVINWQCLLMWRIILCSKLY